MSYCQIRYIINIKYNYFEVKPLLEASYVHVCAGYRDKLANLQGTLNAIL